MIRPTLPALGALALLFAACGTEIRTDRALPSAIGDGAAPGPAAAQAAAAPAADSALVTVLFSEHDADVAARKEGVVRALRVELGDAVADGAPLAALDDETEAARLEAARADADQAAKESARQSELGQRQLAAMETVEASASRARVAHAAVSEAEAALERTIVRAPFAGVVTRRYVRLGQSVDEGAPVFRVTALRPLRAELQVPEAAVRRLAVGHTLTLLGVAGEQVRGTVARIAPAVDPVSGTVSVLVDVADPGRLRPGATVRVRLPSP